MMMAASSRVISLGKSGCSIKVSSYQQSAISDGSLKAGYSASLL
jgi:hypothetical protein